MESKPPSNIAAICLTFSAVCDLFASFMIVASKPDIYVLALFIMCDMFLIALAIYLTAIKSDYCLTRSFLDVHGNWPGNC